MLYAVGYCYVLFGWLLLCSIWLVIAVSPQSKQPGSMSTIDTMLWAGWPKDGGSIPRKLEIFLSSKVSCLGIKPTRLSVQ